jgi:hypothetical protein
LNAGQIDAVDFFVLADQGIVRRTEHWMPEYAPEVTQEPVATVDAVQGEGGPRRDHRNENRKHDHGNRGRARRFTALRSSRH